MLYNSKCYCIGTNDESFEPVIEDGKVTGLKVRGADTVYPFNSSGSGKIAYGNTGVIAKGDTKIIPLDFTPDFVCMAEPSEGQKAVCFCGMKCNENSEVISQLEYAPNMIWFVINRDTYSNNYSMCKYITITENQIEIDPCGWGTNSGVFWLAVKLQ